MTAGALPSIRVGLGFSPTSLSWVVKPICSPSAASCCWVAGSAICLGTDASSLAVSGSIEAGLLRFHASVGIDAEQDDMEREAA